MTHQITHNKSRIIWNLDRRSVFAGPRYHSFSPHKTRILCSAVVITDSLNSWNLTCKDDGPSKVRLCKTTKPGDFITLRTLQEFVKKWTMDERTGMIELVFAADVIKVYKEWDSAPLGLHATHVTLYAFGFSVKMFWRMWWQIMKSAIHGILETLPKRTDFRRN